MFSLIFFLNQEKEERRKNKMVFIVNSKKEKNYWWIITLLGCIWFVGLPILYFSLGLDHSKKPFLEIIMIILAVLIPLLIVFFIYKAIKSTFEEDKELKKELIKKLKSPSEVKKEFTKSSILLTLAGIFFIASILIINFTTTDNLTGLICGVIGMAITVLIIWFGARRWKRFENKVKKK